MTANEPAPEARSSYTFLIAFVVGAAAAGVGLLIHRSRQQPEQRPAEPAATIAPAPSPAPVDTASERPPTPVATEAPQPAVATSATSLAEALEHAIDREDPARRPSAKFDEKAAREALRKLADEAGGCRRVGSPVGTAYVSVIFGASGQVQSARVTNPPYVGTPTADCIVERVREIRVPPFRGNDVTLSEPVRLR